MDEGMEMGVHRAGHAQGYDYGHRFPLSRSLDVEVKVEVTARGLWPQVHGINCLPADLPSPPFQLP